MTEFAKFVKDFAEMNEKFTVSYDALLETMEEYHIGLLLANDDLGQIMSSIALNPLNGQNNDSPNANPIAKDISDIRSSVETITSEKKSSFLGLRSILIGAVSGLNPLNGRNNVSPNATNANPMAKDISAIRSSVETIKNHLIDQSKFSDLQDREGLLESSRETDTLDGDGKIKPSSKKKGSLLGLTSILLGAVAGVLTAPIAILLGFDDWLKRFRGYKDLRTTFSGLFKGLRTRFTGLFEKFDRFFGKDSFIVRFFGRIGKILKPLGAILGRLTGAGGMFKTFMKTFKLTFKFFRTFGRLLGPLGIVITVVTAIIDFVKGFTKGFKEGGLMEGLKQGIIAVVDGLIGGLISGIAGIIAWIAEKLGFEEYAEDLLAGAEEFRRIFRNALGGIWDVVTWMPRKISELAMEVWDFGKKLFSGEFNIGERIKNFFNSILGLLYDQVLKIWYKLPPRVRSAANSFQFVRNTIKGMEIARDELLGSGPGTKNTISSQTTSLINETTRSLQQNANINQNPPSGTNSNNTVINTNNISQTTNTHQSNDFADRNYDVSYNSVYNQNYMLSVM